MAFTDLGSIASGGSSGNNQASLTVATTASCSAGELVVVAVSVDNRATGGGDDLSTSGVVLNTSGGSLVLTLTKGRQNATNLAAQAGAAVSLWYGVLPSSYASGGNIVASFTTAASADATALSARHFSFTSGATLSVEATNAGTATTTNPGSLNATTANLPCLRIRAIGCEYDSTQALTVTASWTAWTEGASAASGTITEQVIEAEHRISTGTGDASAPTLGSACDSASVYVAFKEVFTFAADGSSYSLTGASASLTETITTEYLPAGIAGIFNPWGSQRLPPDTVWPNSLLYAAQGTTFSAAAGSYALTGSDAALTAVTADTANLPAGGTNWFNPWGPQQPQRTWTQAGIQVTPVALVAASGSYTLTGTAAAVAFGQVAGSGSYSITGSSVALALGHVAATGSYSLTGSSAALAIRHVAGASSYTLTGSSTALAFGHVVAGGSYTITGTAAALALQHVAGSGSYTLTGADAAFVTPGGLPAAAGSYTLTGADAAFVIPGAVDYLPAGMSGGYVPWGRPYPIVLRTSAGRVLSAAAPFTLTADAGSYGLTGTTAGLTVSGAVTYLPAGITGGYAPWGRPPRDYWIWSVAYTTAPGGVTLSAGAGSYTLSGSAAGLTATTFQYIFRPPLITRIWSRSRQVAVSAQNWVLRNQFVGSVRLSADAGSYVVTGSSVALALRLTANTGSYTLTGFAEVPAVALPAAAGSYALTGSDAVLALRLTANAGSYVLTGSAVAPTTGFPAAAGSYTLTGSAANFVGGGTGVVLTAAIGSYAITGTDAVLTTAFPFSAAAGSYDLTGTAANLATPGFFTAGSGSYALTGTDAQLIQAGTIVLPAGAGSYLITGADADLLISIPPPEVIPPPAGGIGAGFRVGRYKQFKLKKKRKHDQCEELLEYLRSLPPAEAEAAVAELPPRYLSLLDGLPLPHALVLPPAAARNDDDDDDACALLLELLLR